MDLALNAVQWVVGKALAPVADGLLQSWAAGNQLGPNMEALRMELLLVKATLENAGDKQLDGRQALEQLLQKMQDLAHNAEDVLDELDYFRIHDDLYGTCDAANEDARGCGHNLLMNARHTAKGVGKVLSCTSASTSGDHVEEDATHRVLCCAPPRARQRTRNSSSSGPDISLSGEEVSSRMSKFGLVLESLQPHRNLQELYIRGNKGTSCPTWLGDKLDVEALKSLHLFRVSWDVFPSFGKMWDLRELTLNHISTIKEFGLEESLCKLLKKITLTGLENFEKWVPQPTHFFPHLQVLIIIDCPKLSELPFSSHIVYPLKQDWNIDWFPKLQELTMENCPEVLLLPPIPWTHSMCSVEIRDVGSKLLDKLMYSKSSSGLALKIDGKGGLHNLDQVLLFSQLAELQELTIVNCQPLELKYFLMLTSLKKLWAWSSNLGVVSSGGQSGVEWQHPVEDFTIGLSGSSGKELTQFLSHLPKLSKLEVLSCINITQFAVGVDLQQTTVPVVSSSTSLDVITMDDTQVKDEQQEIAEVEKEEANTVDDDGLLLLPAHLSNSLQALHINDSIGVVVHSLEALQALTRLELEDCSFRHPFPSSLLQLKLSSVKGVLTLSNLTSLTRLEIYGYGEDFRCEGLLPLLTRGQLSDLHVQKSPNFFGRWEWDPSAPISRSSKLQMLNTDDIQGFLGAPALCSLLSSSLTYLHFSYSQNGEMTRFTNEQEEAFQCLTSLQRLEFWFCYKLEHLPAALNKLTNLKRLVIFGCLAVRSLPKDGLPSSLRELVAQGVNEELREHCKRLIGTIPKIII
ncbi:putative disease resistance protein RGA4 [Hordeum vulgare]|nr:putative disease resistance protein RGA4 [Hordeum vulgare]